MNIAISPTTVTGRTMAMMRCCRLSGTKSKDRVRAKAVGIESRKKKIREVLSRWNDGLGGATGALGNFAGLGIGFDETWLHRLLTNCWQFDSNRWYFSSNSSLSNIQLMISCRGEKCDEVEQNRRHRKQGRTHGCLLEGGG